MSQLSDYLFKPADFVIRTPASIRHFLIKSARCPNAYKPSRAMRLAIYIFSKIQIGTMDVILPDGKKLQFLGKENGPNGILIVHDDRMVRRFMIGGKLAFCESYLDGDWSSPNMAEFFEMVLRNERFLQNALMGKSWFRRLSWLSHILKPNSRSGSKKNIYAHYDLGNDFYAAWLDPTMTYSSALFDNQNFDLKEAQEAKYAEILKHLDLEAHHHILEIGCGWGGFAEYAATHCDCKITCITISKAQFDYAQDRIQKAGLSDRISLALQDYRDIKGHFDRIVSIEMFEAVGEKYWPTYFDIINKSLVAGGKAVLQIITIEEESFDDYRRSADYIQRYIFPGGMLPSKTVLSRAISKAGLVQNRTLCFGRDYAQTLKIWNDRFQAVWPKLQSRNRDLRFKRLWEQYFAYCQAGFNAGTIDVIQIGISKPTKM